ncbi:KH domain-containing, RNA-binding, signal transduction-associated protein 3-like, partial [Limulus polyphemus]|uniref:KH domain-containing, RNA-binding, signal transduction-associated protein 3-like n=1 Tax=Limulus polyphemus TaxID=6850 RepID=A0ABM1C386_LIMPO
MAGNQATNHIRSSSQYLIEIHKGRPIKHQVKVLVPVKDHPNFNFVGKLLGPKGNSLKQLQEETQTKMAVLGKGSMRDKKKEEDLRQLEDPKFFHLREDLHVEITAFAPAAEAYSRMAVALTRLKPFLVPDYYDEIRQKQLRELAILNKIRQQDSTTDNKEPSPPPIGKETFTLQTKRQPTTMYSHELLNGKDRLVGGILDSKRLMPPGGALRRISLPLKRFIYQDKPSLAPSNEPMLIEKRQRQLCTQTGFGRNENGL